MYKASLYSAIILCVFVLAACRKKTKDAPPPWTPSHYPTTYVRLDSLSDIILPQHCDTVIAMPVKLYFDAYVPSLVTVTFGDMPQYMSVSPLADSVSSDTVKMQFIPSFSLHINAVDTGVFPVKIQAKSFSKLSGSYYTVSEFNVRVR